MNYIGSKQTLLPFIDEVLMVTIGDRIQSFTDGFAGTGIVSRNIQKNKPKVKEKLKEFIDKV
jgi:adenine-specific DNA-methyltransferase